MVANIAGNLYTGKVVYIEGKPYGVASRLSPSIKQFSQDTGRWSQTGPPMAQLPVKMRKIIDCDPYRKQLGYDVSNAELRIVAIISGDEVFLDSFALGWDLHTLNACELFEMEYPPSRVKKDIHFGETCEAWRIQYGWEGEDDPRRKFGKIFNFRTLYGGSPKTAYQIPGASKLGRSRSELEQAGYRWLAAHPRLNAFWEKHGMEAMHRFCVRNSFGRRRVLCSVDDMARWREGVNHPVQSFVTELINRIVVETYIKCNGCSSFQELRAKLAEQPTAIRLMGQMHDSLLWDFAEDDYDRLSVQALAIAQAPFEVDGHEFQFPVSSYSKEAHRVLNESAERVSICGIA